MKNRMLAWAALATLLAPVLGAQTFSHEISLAGLGDPNAAVRPFGISYEPTTDRLYVAIAGTFSSNNSSVAVIDATTDTVLHTIDVGLFPEDIAFAYAPTGSYLYGAVTNSSSGSVTIWDANDQVLATVQLPDPWGMGTCYPFGICLNRAGTHFLVSTNDGSGMVYSIELGTWVQDTMHDFQMNAGAGGRLKSTSNRLFIPTTTYTASWSGSEAGLETHGVPNSAGTLPTENNIFQLDDTFSTYPSAADVEVLSDGRVLVSGMSCAGQLWVYSGQGEPLRAIQTADAYGLAVNADETVLAMCTLAGDTILFVDLETYEVIQEVFTNGLGGNFYSMPNEAVFANDKLFVTMQANEAVVVLDNLPMGGGTSAFAGSLTVGNATPNPGESVTISLSGSGAVALVSSTGNTPTLASNGLMLNIGPDHLLRGSAMRNFTRSYRIPATAQMRGMHFFIQGIVDARGLAIATAPRAIVIQ